MAAAVHLPMLGAYSASKAAVEALGNTLRIELRPSGARVGVGYFAELDTDMTSRGFGTEAAGVLISGPTKRIMRVAPLEVGIDALERGIARRSRRVVAPALEARRCRSGCSSSARSTRARGVACATRSRSPGARTRRSPRRSPSARRLSRRSRPAAD